MEDKTEKPLGEGMSGNCGSTPQRKGATIQGAGGLVCRLPQDHAGLCQDGAASWEKEFLAQGKDAMASYIAAQTQVWRQQRIRIEGKVVPRDVWGIPGTDRKKSYGWIGYLGKRIMVGRGAEETIWEPITDEELGIEQARKKGRGKKGKQNG